MKMVIVLAVCLALLASSASALQMPWMGMGMGMQTMWQPNFSCQPLRQQCCQQMRMMDMQSWPGMISFMQQLQMMMQLQGTTAASSLYLQPALMQQLQQLLPVAQALTPMAMAVAQVAQNMPAMCGPYQQLPSYCTTACAASAAIPPYY